MRIGDNGNVGIAGDLLVDGGDIGITGDTDLIPEMQKLTGHNQSDKEVIALLPIGGRFTMSA